MLAKATKMIGLTLCMMICSGFLLREGASALTYQQDIDMSFTFNPTLSVSLSSADLTIDSLSPGTAADSNIVTVNILTNSVVGYTLNATVGNNTTYNTRNLVHNNTSESASFASVDYSSTPTITSNTALSPSTWAYSYSTNNGTTWANYNGLPLYSDTTNIATLKDTDGPVSSSTGDEVKFKIAAKADYDQQVGTYGNVVNFALVAKTIPAYSVTLGLSGAESIIIDKGTPNEATYTSGSTIESLTVGIHTISGAFPTGYNFGSWSASGGVTVADVTALNTTVHVDGDGTLTLTGEEPKLYMWDASSADCGTTMYDNRDGTERAYTTATIGSLCWMTTNLALGASSSVTLYKATTNITADTYILPARGTYGTSDSGQYVWGTDNTTCSDNSPCYGYYSYAAATAGTNPSSGAATSDICPKGWRLPTIAEYGTLSITYTTGATLTASPFLGVYGGSYYNGSFDGGSYGSYWSSTAHDSSLAEFLTFNSSYAVPDYEYKNFGRSVRCVAKS